MTGHARTVEREEDSAALVLHRGALDDILLSLDLLAALPSFLGLKKLNIVGNQATLTILENQPFIGHIFDQDRSLWAGLYADPPGLNRKASGLVLSHQAGVVFTRQNDDPAVAGLRNRR